MIPTNYIYTKGTHVEIESFPEKHPDNVSNWTNDLVRGLTGIIDKIEYGIDNDGLCTARLFIKLDNKSKDVLAKRCNNIYNLQGWCGDCIMLVNPIFKNNED